MGQLDGKTVIVTGAAQGIGAAYARGLAEEGANVVINDVLDPSPLVDEIAANGGVATGIIADVTNDSQIADMVSQTVDTYGRIDGLINNAALFGKLARRRFEEIDIDEFDAVMRVNIRGVWQYPALSSRSCANRNMARSSISPPAPSLRAPRCSCITSPPKARSLP